MLNTYHSNGEIIVDDLIRHGVSFLLIVLCDHLYAPAIHEHQGTSLDILQDPTQN